MNNLMVSSFYLEGSLLRVEVKAVDWAFGSRPRPLTTTHVARERRDADIKGTTYSTWE